MARHCSTCSVEGAEGRGSICSREGRTSPVSPTGAGRGRSSTTEVGPRPDPMIAIETASTEPATISPAERRGHPGSRCRSSSSPARQREPRPPSSSMSRTRPRRREHRSGERPSRSSSAMARMPGPGWSGCCMTWVDSPRGQARPSSGTRRGAADGEEIDRGPEVAPPGPTLGGDGAGRALEGADRGGADIPRTWVMPKSATFTTPDLPRRTLAGSRSRCMTPKVRPSGRSPLDPPLVSRTT